MSDGGVGLGSLRQQLEDIGRSKPIAENPQPTTRERPSWIVPESTDDNEALADVEEDNYAKNDAPLEGPSQGRILAELPSILRAGVGGRRPAAHRGGNRGGNRGPRPALPGMMLKPPSPSAAERARRRALERSMYGILLPKTVLMAPAANPWRRVSSNSRQSTPQPDRGPPSPYPRFERALQRRLQSGRYDQEAIRYYLDLASRPEVTHRYPNELGDLNDILSNDARPSSGATVRQEWTPAKVLGSGSYGEVILWERITAVVTYPETLVCKTLSMDHFFRDYNEEALLTHKLNATSCRNVVKVYDWSHHMQEDWARIIYEYCPYGDLQMLIDFYDKHNLVFPEAFMWHVFHSIATTICYCSRGTTDNEPVPGWVEIVHKDLKPNNVFLAAPDEDGNSLYPTLKVADFGLGYEIPNENVRQFKRVYRSLGNVYGAPEIREELRSDKKQTPYEFPTPRLDIYSLGIIMLFLLRMPTERYSNQEWRCLDLDWEYSRRYYPYSEDLVNLARQCFHQDAMQRPDPFDLYQITRTQTEHFSAVTAGNRRRANQSGAPGGVYDGKVLWFQADRDKYTTTGTYRRAFRKHAEWFGRNAQAMIDLEVAALTPRCPSRRGLVGIGHGLGGFFPEQQLREMMAGVPLERWLMLYEPVPEDNGVPNLQYIGQNRLRFPRYDKNWRAQITGEGSD